MNVRGSCRNKQATLWYAIKVANEHHTSLTTKCAQDNNDELVGMGHKPHTGKKICNSFSNGGSNRCVFGSWTAGQWQLTSWTSAWTYWSRLVLKILILYPTERFQFSGICAADELLNLFLQVTHFLCDDVPLASKSMFCASPSKEN